MLDFVKTTVIGGLLVIVPVVAVLAFAAKMISTLISTFEPLASRLLGEPVVCDLASIALIVVLAEIEEALVAAFLVEEHEDGGFTVFVSAVRTTIAGAIYVSPRERVHPVDVPFATAIQCFTRCGEETSERLQPMWSSERASAPA